MVHALGVVDVLLAVGLSPTPRRGRASKHGLFYNGIMTCNSLHSENSMPTCDIASADSLLSILACLQHLAPIPMAKAWGPWLVAE